MAEIRPFKALRYNLEKAGEIGSLVCPPYDVIGEEQRRALAEGNPYNVIQLELPQGEDCYTQAGKTLEQWMDQGVLKTDMDEGIYIYEEEFLDKVDRGNVKTLRGMVCLVRLEDFSANVVLPHEETLSKAKEDRFQLMCATGCNFSQIYSLYRDETHITRGRLDALTQTCRPRYQFSDGLVTHRLWVVNDEVAISALREDFTDRKLYIADGHHRYETALRYRDHLRDQGIYLPNAGFVMMFLADMGDSGLVVFPTHRLVRGLPDFRADILLAACDQYFDAAAQKDRAETERALEEAYGEGRHAFGLFDGVRWHTLTLRNPAVLDALLPGKSEAYRQLDVTILHTLILEGVLGIDKANMAAQKNLTYTRSAEEAERSVETGESQCCFLLNPTRVEEIGAVAAAGEKMPQKSTYFYPKLITGLVMNRFQEPEPADEFDRS